MPTAVEYGATDLYDRYSSKGSGSSSVDYFLKMDGVKGESQDHKHKGEMQLQSFSWGAVNASGGGYGGGMGVGKVKMADFHFLTHTHAGSPALMLACATGEHIKTAVLTCRKAGKEQQEYLKFTFTDVMVTSFQLNGAEHLPIETVSLAYSKIEMEYKEQKNDGSLAGAVKAGWDLKATQKV